eukprot:1739656-Prymnesium_polylepis.1
MLYDFVTLTGDKLQTAGKFTGQHEWYRSGTIHAIPTLAVSRARRRSLCAQRKEKRQTLGTSRAT